MGRARPLPAHWLVLFWATWWVCLLGTASPCRRPLRAGRRCRRSPTMLADTTRSCFAEHTSVRRRGCSTTCLLGRSPPRVSRPSATSFGGQPVGPAKDGKWSTAIPDPPTLNSTPRLTAPPPPSRANAKVTTIVNVETMLVDDDGRPVRAGVKREIVHRSPHAAAGYWNDPEKTPEAFRDGWFHSGDLGVIAEDGYITVVDRKKDMIKTGGENIASREVEEVLYQHAAVAEVAVLGIPHPTWIEAVAAVVVPREG